MWIVARLEPRHEWLGMFSLQRANVTTYRPLTRQRRTMRGKFVTRVEPLFMSYVFVLLPTEQWHAVRWSPGIASVVMSGEQPARVRDEIIAELRSRERGGYVELPGLRPGDRMRVKAGLFTGLTGLYAGQAAHARVVILLRLLGAQRQVTMAACCVEAAG